MPQIRSLLGAARSTYEHVTIAWEPGVVTVQFPSGRGQVLRYAALGEMLRFRTTVLKPAAARELGLEQLAEDLVDRNRETPVVAFGFSTKGHVEAWIDQRASTLQADELRFYLLTLAAEADRLEYLLTGRDVQ